MKSTTHRIFTENNKHSDIYMYIYKLYTDYKRMTNKSPEYLLCDIDTRYEIMDDKSIDIEIREDGGYYYNNMMICIADGLHHKRMLVLR